MEDPINPDNCGHISENLTVQQHNAIDLLIQGKSDRQVSEALDLRRQTVCDWRNHNPAFASELNRRRHDLWSSHADRLRQLASNAIDILAKDLVLKSEYPSEGARRIRQSAVQILKACGLYRDTLPPNPSNKP
ncbi:MAG: hypothetical protein ACJ78Q_16580 [Chloroflexia bacterium]